MDITRTSIEEQLRQAVLGSGVPMYLIARDAGLTQASLWRFSRKAGAGLRLKSAEKLMRYFGWEMNKRDP
jgi:hypothetical protein